MASAKVGSPITSCQLLTGNWLVIRVAGGGVAVRDDLRHVVALIRGSWKQTLMTPDLRLSETI